MNRPAFPMKRYLPLSLVAAALVLRASALAQDLPSAAPETLGFSADRLARIAAAVQHDVDGKRVSGAVTLVVRHGQVAWFDARGMADREAGKPMQKDAIFRICSMTKPITSTAVMMLYEEGRFLLEDPISKYLPEFKDPKVLVKPASGAPYSVPASREITIRDLLRHTSGLTYNWNADVGKAYDDAGVASGLLQYDGTIGDSVKKLAGIPLVYNPGEKWEYSLSVDVLGRLVEVVSGMPLDQFFRTRIFEPLGMKDSYFYLPPDKAGRLAAAYAYFDDKDGMVRFPDTPVNEGTLVYSADYPVKGPRKLFSGGAGLCATAMDYARFCQMMLNGGKLGDVRILSRKSVEIMSHDQLGPIDPKFGFGLGFGVLGKAPLEELGSAGAFRWGGFFFTSFIIDPKEDMIVISMAQLHPTGGLDLEEKVQVLAYEALND
jgi:CubicO group peptidase (beta-lactamase class C family)